MLLDCKNCKKKFTLIDDEIKLEGQLVKCIHCKQEWIYEKYNYLENRLTTLNQDLYRTEVELNEQNNKHSEKIDQLEKDLKIKKDELIKQKLLEERIGAFEKRITDTEKKNSEQADLEIKISKMENEVQNVSENIFTRGKNIEKKANYIEMKINSYSEENKNIKNNINKVIKKNIIDDNKSEVVNFKIFEKEDKNKKKQLIDNKKKNYFFWPSNK